MNDFTFRHTAKTQPAAKLQPKWTDGRMDVQALKNITDLENNHPLCQFEMPCYVSCKFQPLSKWLLSVILSSRTTLHLIILGLACPYRGSP